jgi:hypothetical protein
MKIMRKIQKKQLAVAAFLACAVFVVGGCSVIDHPNNKKQDGYWHLVKVDTLETGGVKDFSNDLIFWSIQARLMTVNDRSETSTTGQGFVMHMTIKNKTSIHIYDIRYHAKADGDPEVTNVDELRPFGINQLDETFTIESVSGSKMILKDDMLRLYFKRM